MNAILLAAGLSSRMGQDKAFLLYKKQPIIEILLDKLARFSQEIILVGGRNYDNLKEFLESYKHKNKVKLVHNPNYLKGMFSSIKVAIKSLPDSSPFFLQMIDQPFVDEEIYQQLQIDFDPSSYVFQPQAEVNGTIRNGHPIIINHLFTAMILKHDDEYNLRDIIRTIPDKRKFMLVKNTTIFDNLNTREAFIEKVKGIENGDSSN